MGPVSFQSLAAGDTRAGALDLAARLEAAGIRVVSVVAPGPGAADGFRLVLRSEDTVRARDLLVPGP